MDEYDAEDPWEFEFDPFFRLRSLYDNGDESDPMDYSDEYFFSAGYDMDDYDDSEDYDSCIDDRSLTFFDVLESYPPPCRGTGSRRASRCRRFYLRCDGFNPLKDFADKVEREMEDRKEDGEERDSESTSEDYEEPSAMLLMDSFYIDDGSIDHVDSRRAFVLGVEWAIFRNYIIGCDILANEPYEDENGEKFHDEGFEFFCHDENVERLKRLSAMHMRIASSESVGDGWSVVSVGKRDDFLNSLLKR